MFNFDKLYLRKTLEIPEIYSWFQKQIAKKNYREWFFKKYIGDTSDKRILDLGCGTADILDYIRDEKLYVGIDNNKQYIEKNKRIFADRETCKFYHADLNAYSEKATQKFDIVLMIGVMHHIDDNAVNDVMTCIKRIIADGGIYVSLDPCYTKDMNPIARLLCMLDRGRYVRYADDFIRIQEKYWTDVKYDIRTDTLRFLPYSVIIFTNKDKSEGCE